MIEISRIPSYAAAALLLATGLSGCGTFAVIVPGPIIESPEIRSSVGKVEVGFGLEDATKYVYTSDASSRPPNLNAAEIKSDVPYISGRGGYALFEWLEVGVRLLPGSVNTLFIGGIGATTRVQIVGSGAGPGLKVAVYGGALQTSSSSSGDQNGNFGNGGHNWKAIAKAVTLTAGTSIGVRFQDPDVLVFIAGAYADQAITGGSIDHALSSDGLSPAVSYALRDVKGITRTVAVGLRVGKQTQLGLDARLINRSWPGLSNPETRGGGESSQAAYGLSLHFPM